MSLNMKTSRTGIKHKPLSIFKMLNIINKVYCILNIPQNKITEKLCIPTRKVTYIKLGVSDRGKNVLRLLQIIQIWYRYMSSQKSQLFSQTVLHK